MTQNLIFCFRQCLGGFQDRKSYEQFQCMTQCFVLLMTNLLKSYKGEDHIIYPVRDDEDTESRCKWENLLANFNDEGKYFVYFQIALYIHCSSVYSTFYLWEYFATYEMFILMYLIQ